MALVDQSQFGAVMYGERFLLDSFVKALDSQLWLRPTGRAVPLVGIFFNPAPGDNPRGCEVVALASVRGVLFPIRLRFRVVHVTGQPLTLELVRVPEPMQIRRLWLLRLPAWETWRRAVVG